MWNRVQNRNQYKRIDFDSEHWTFVLCLKKDSANLEECFRTGCSRLKHDGENGEDDDLDGGAARVPVGAADSVLKKDSI